MSRLFAPRKCKNCDKNWAIVSTDFCANCTPQSSNKDRLRVCGLCKKSMLEKYFPINRGFCTDCANKFDNYGERVCENCETRFTQNDFKSTTSVDPLCKSCEQKSKIKFLFWASILIPFILYGCWMHINEPSMKVPIDLGVDMNEF